LPASGIVFSTEVATSTTGSAFRLRLLFFQGVGLSEPDCVSHVSTEARFRSVTVSGDTMIPSADMALYAMSLLVFDSGSGSTAVAAFHERLNVFPGWSFSKAAFAVFTAVSIAES
jgi:hypothetical protein